MLQIFRGAAACAARLAADKRTDNICRNSTNKQSYKVQRTVIFVVVALPHSQVAGQVQRTVIFVELMPPDDKQGAAHRNI